MSDGRRRRLRRIFPIFEINGFRKLILPQKERGSFYKKIRRIERNYRELRDRLSSSDCVRQYTEDDNDYTLLRELRLSFRTPSVFLASADEYCASK